MNGSARIHTSGHAHLHTSLICAYTYTTLAMCKTPLLAQPDQARWTQFFALPGSRCMRGNQMHICRHRAWDFACVGHGKGQPGGLAGLLRNHVYAENFSAAALPPLIPLFHGLAVRDQDLVFPATRTTATAWASINAARFSSHNTAPIQPVCAPLQTTIATTISAGPPTGTKCFWGRSWGCWCLAAS